MQAVFMQNTREFAAKQHVCIKICRMQGACVLLQCSHMEQHFKLFADANVEARNPQHWP